LRGKVGRKRTGRRGGVGPESHILHVLPLVQGNGVADSLAREVGFRFFLRQLEGEGGVWKLKLELEESSTSAVMSTTLPVVFVLGGVEVYLATLTPTSF
jgi:hypothetical protein